MFFDTFQNETTDPIFGTTEDRKSFDRNENKSCRADSKPLGGKRISEVEKLHRNKSQRSYSHKGQRNSHHTIDQEISHEYSGAGNKYCTKMNSEFKEQLKTQFMKDKKFLDERRQIKTDIYQNAKPAGYPQNLDTLDGSQNQTPNMSIEQENLYFAGTTNEPVAQFQSHSQRSQQTPVNHINIEIGANIALPNNIYKSKSSRWNSRQYHNRSVNDNLINHNNTTQESASQDLLSNLNVTALGNGDRYCSNNNSIIERPNEGSCGNNERSFANILNKQKSMDSSYHG
jgi:hypothetical protein